MKILRPRQNNLSQITLLVYNLVNMSGVLIIKPSLTVTTEVFNRQSMDLNDQLMEKTPQIALKRNNVIILHDNATMSYVTLTTRDTLMQLQWDVLLHLVYFPDFTSSDF